MEILVAVFILGMLTIAIVGLATLGTRTAFEAERQTVAQGLVNQHVERIRVLGYDQVGYTSPQAGEPDGVLLRSETRAQNSQQYTVATTISLIDDPLNGAQLPLTESSADYKKVEIKVTWQPAGSTLRDVYVVTYVARGAIPILSSPSISPSPSITPSVTPTFLVTSTATPSSADSAPNPPPCVCPNGTACVNGTVCCEDCLGTGCPAPSSGFSTGGYCYYTSWTCSLTSMCSATGAGCSPSTTYYPCYTPTPTITPTPTVSFTPTPTVTPTFSTLPTPSS